MGSQVAGAAAGRAVSSVFASGETRRSAERIAIAYFLFTATLGTVYGLSRGRLAMAWTLPVLLWAVGALERRYSRRWSSMLRDWVPLFLTLIGYWQVDWFADPAKPRFDHLWIGFDRLLLNGLGLRAGIESLGGLMPSALEFIYLCMYALPLLCMAALYLTGARRHANRFLFTFFLGTFTAYALLPFFPTASPRVAFATVDLPNYGSVWRTINIWLLDKCDITTSVFPSGHVVAAFASGFGLLRAVPEQRRLWASVFAVATLVFVATVYCRYHYAADGIASIGIAALAWLVSGALDDDA